MLDMNDKQQLIFGHYLGGLLLVQTLVREPQLFSHYYICSPSLWWNQEQVLQEALHISQVECANLHCSGASGEISDV